MGAMVGKVLSAARYTWRFEELTTRQHGCHGANWTLKLPGLQDSVVTTDRELIKQVLTGNPLKRRHANDILEPALGGNSVMLLEPAGPPAKPVRRGPTLVPSGGAAVRVRAR
jgi:cytochrome P450